MDIKTFKYKAYSSDKKLERGIIHAATRQESILLLQSRGLSPVEIIEKHNAGRSLFSSGITRADLIEFTEALGTLVEADVPIDRALFMLRGIINKDKARQIIDSLRQQIKEGKGLAQAMMLYPDVFPGMYVYMIQAGEENGILKELLPRLEKSLIDEAETKNQIVSALIYPVILGVFGFLSVVMLLLFVVPKFAVVFDDTGGAVPASTMFLLSLSSLLKQYVWLLMLLPGAAIILWKYLNNSEELRGRRDDLLLRVPVMGKIILLKESAGFCKTLGALLHAGIPLMKALATSRTIIGNQSLRRVIERLEDDVRGGMSLGDALHKHGKFPDVLAQLVRVGEESGGTADILLKLGSTFDKNVKKMTDRLVSLLEPLIILLLGVVVGGIVLIMMSSVMSMNDIGI